MENKCESARKMMSFAFKLFIIVAVGVSIIVYLSHEHVDPFTHKGEKQPGQSSKNHHYRQDSQQLVPDITKNPLSGLDPLERRIQDRDDISLASTSSRQLSDLKLKGIPRFKTLSRKKHVYDQTQETVVPSQRISDDTSKSNVQAFTGEKLQPTSQSRNSNRGLKATQWSRSMKSGLEQTNRGFTKLSRQNHHNLIKRSYVSLKNRRYNHKSQQTSDNTEIKGKDWALETQILADNVNRCARSAAYIPLVHSSSCFFNDTFVNCSLRNLFEVPTVLFPATISTYLLFFNRFTNIREFAFARYRVLKILDLSRSGLKFLCNNSFAGLEYLLHLDLSWNHLTQSDFLADVFAPLGSLEILRLNVQTQLRIFQLSYPDLALSKLTNLKELYIDGLSSDFGPGFKNLTKLHKLILGGLCTMNFLKNTTFINVPNVSFLSLKSCEILGYLVEADAFSPLTKLAFLDLSKNFDIGIENLNTIFHGLRETTTLKHLRINYVNGYRFSGQVHCLESRYISNFPQHLEVLEASYNNLELVDRGVIEKLSPTLKILNVSANPFVFGPYLNDLSKMKNLTKLIYYGDTAPHPPNKVNSHKKFRTPNCSHYQTVLPATSDVNEFVFQLPPKLRYIEITDTELIFLRSTSIDFDSDNELESLVMYRNYIPSGTLFCVDGLPKLTSLILRSNNIKQVEDVLMYSLLPSLKTLDLSSNSISLVGCSFEDSENLESLNLSHNQISVIYKAAFIGLDSLKELYLRGNRLVEFPVNMIWVPNLEKLDLSYNELTTLHENAFQDLFALKKLYLRNNRLDKFLVNMSHVPNLEHLDLSNNELTSLPENVFQDLFALNRLHLRNNGLDKFLVNISHLLNLELLDLSNNNIVLLSGTIRKYIDLIQPRHENITLNLAGNPISCNCNNFEFLKWFSQSKFKVELGNVGRYKCIYSDNSLKYITDRYKSTFAELSRECISNYAIFLISGATTLFLLCLIIGGILYRFRWNLRYFYYAAYLRYKKVGTNTDTNYEFDLFISYAEEDTPFVVDTMSPELERRGIKMLIHGRDFKAGEYIATNIVNAVGSSKKTLVVLTRNMMNSYWCGYELQMANMESVHRGDKVLIFLLMEKIPESELGVELLYNIRNNTYIPYPDTLPDDTSMDRLWDKLVADIKS